MPTPSSHASDGPSGQARSDTTRERSKVVWPVAAIRSVGDAILHTVVYADLFDYPLTAEQIHQYLTGCTAPLSLVREHLAGDRMLRERLDTSPPYWFLAGRKHLIALRQEREAYSQVLWAAAWRYGRLLAGLPFVRMVAVTGALAMNNASSVGDDLDFLLVTGQGRVWLARGLAILVVHMARVLGLEICPNYVLPEHRLHLGDPSLYTAHELAQLVPLYRSGIYRRLLESNAWISDYLPNARPQRPAGHQIGTLAQSAQQQLEAVLGGQLGDAIERWEQKRKIPRLRQMAAERGALGAMFTPDLCKGHVDDHAAGIHELYAARLAAQGLQI